MEHILEREDFVCLGEMPLGVGAKSSNWAMNDRIQQKAEEIPFRASAFEQTLVLY